IPRDVRMVELGTRRVVTSVPALIRYLRRERPAALLSTLDTANAVAVLATRLAGDSTRVTIRQANHLSRSLGGESRTSAPLLNWLVRWSYPFADSVVAVSSGVADDLASRVGLSRARIHVVPNPIVTKELTTLAAQPVSHAWFQDPSVP